MGKSDEKALRSATQDEKARSMKEAQSGIDETKSRVDTLLPKADADRSEVQDQYRNFASTGGMGSDAWNNAINTVRGSSGSNGGSGGGGGGAAAPDYLDVFREIAGKTGGFDAKRLADIGSDSTRLRDTGDLDKFAATGGVSQGNIDKIDNATLEELSRTGGFSDVDRANIRARGNAGVADTYQNMQDQMNRQRAATGNFSPGFGAAGFKLARQSAQDVGQQTQATEADIASRVAAGRQTAAGKISDNMLGLSGLQSSNTLAAKKQIADQLSSAGGLDLNTQQLINNSRLAATSGLSQDNLGRMSIGASSAAAQAALDSANARFLYGQQQQGKEFGTGGLADMYRSAPGELTFDQSLLRGYRSDAAGQQLGLLNGPMGRLASSPGWMDYAGQGINMASGVASPILKGFGKALLSGGGGASVNGGQPDPYGPYSPVSDPNME